MSSSDLALITGGILGVLWGVMIFWLYTKAAEGEREGKVEFDSNPTPPEKTYVIRIEYEYRGKGDPLPYPLKDGAEE